MIGTSVVSRESSSKPVAQGTRAPLVMVIDPDETARSVVAVALTRDGCEVVTVASGAQAAVALSRGRTPDVIVLESDLGVDDGLAFCAQLRGETKTAGVPVVLLAKPGDENVKSVAEIVGVDDFVPKPVFARDVAALVRLEHARRGGAKVLTLQASQLSPSHLLRALLATPKSGHLLLARGRCEVAFANGKVLTAHFDGRDGLEALVRGLALTDGAYMLALGPVTAEAKFHCTQKEFVQHGFPRLARWLQVVQRSVPLDARLAVDFGRLAAALPTMPDDVNTVVRLFDGQRRVRDVLLDSALDETTTLEVTTRLYLMGVVGPATAKDQGPRGEFIPKRAPRLFEPRATEAEELMRELFDGTAEIRADLTPPADTGDWYDEAQAKGTGLEVPMPDAGWKAAPLVEAAAALTADLPPALAKQVAAFNIAPQREPRQPTPTEKRLTGFSNGERDLDASLDDAFREMTGDQTAASVPDKSEQLMRDRLLFFGRLNPNSDAQARIQTPELTRAVVPVPRATPPDRPLLLTRARGVAMTEQVAPAAVSAPVALREPVRTPVVPAAVSSAPVALREPVRAPVVPAAVSSAPVALTEPVRAPIIVPAQTGPAAPALELQPRIVTPVMTPAVAREAAQPADASTLALEAEFFGSGALAPAAELPVVAGAVPAEAASLEAPQAATVAEAVLGRSLAEEDELPVAPRTRLGIFLGLAAAALLVVLVVEWALISGDVQPPAQPAVAAVAAQPVAPAPTPAFDVEAPEFYADNSAEVEAALAEGKLLYDEGRYADAITNFDHAVALEPSNVGAWLLLGLARYDAHDDAGAWEAVTTVNQLDPQNARAFLLKATLEFDRREAAQARRSLTRYLELDPQGQFADEAKALMAR